MVLFGTFTDPLTTESGKTTIKSSQDGSLNSQTDKVSNKSEDLSSGPVCAGCQQDCPSHSSPSLCSFLCFTRRVLQDDSCTPPAGTFLYTRYLKPSQPSPFSFSSSVRLWSSSLSAFSSTSASCADVRRGGPGQRSTIMRRYIKLTARTVTVTLNFTWEVIDSLRQTVSISGSCTFIKCNNSNLKMHSL